MRQTLRKIALIADDAHFPPRLRERMGGDTPTRLVAFGNLGLLDLPKTAFFCSAHSYSRTALAAYELAHRWREAGRCVIGGFYTQAEKECLRILLGGSSPVIICPARGLPQSPPPEWWEPLAQGRLLVLTFFLTHEARVLTHHVPRRNQFVVALADDVGFVHRTTGTKLDRLAQTFASLPPPVAI